MSRVRVERGLCIGAGNCTRLARGTFALDEEDIAIVKDANASTDEQLRLAEQKCPAGAIFIEDSGATEGASSF